MATDSANTSVTNTLVAATVDTVTLTGFGTIIQVVHHGVTTSPLYVRMGAGVAANVTDPVSEANENLVVMPGTATNFGWPVESYGASAIVKLICAGAEKYTIQVLQDRLR